VLNPDSQNLKQILKAFFNGKELNSLIDTEEVVVYGTVVMKDFALSEVASPGVGFGDILHAIIKSSTGTTATITTVFQSSPDDVRSFSFPVFEGIFFKRLFYKLIVMLANCMFILGYGGFVSVVMKGAGFESTMSVASDGARLPKEEIGRLVEEHGATNPIASHRLDVVVTSQDSVVSI